MAWGELLIAPKIFIHITENARVMFLPNWTKIIACTCNFILKISTIETKS